MNFKTGQRVQLSPDYLVRHGHPPAELPGLLEGIVAGVGLTTIRVRWESGQLGFYEHRDLEHRNVIDRIASLE